MEKMTLPQDSCDGIDSIKRFVQENGVAMKSELSKGQGLLDRVQDMTAQMEDLYSDITSGIRPQLADSTGQLELLTADLSDTTQLLQLLSRLLPARQQLADAEQMQQDGQLAAAAELLVQLPPQLEALEEDTGGMVPAVAALQQRALLQREALQHALDGQLSAALQWQDGALTITENGLAQAVEATRRLGRLQRPLKTLSAALLQQLVAPLLSGAALHVQQRPGSVTLCAEPASVEDAAAGAESTDPAAVERAYAEVLALLKALPASLAAALGVHAAAPLTQQLMAGPLARAVPATLEDRPRFDAVIDSTRRFSQELTDLGFWDGGDELLRHVQDADRLVVDRLVGERLQRARQLAAAELQVTVPVGEAAGEERQAAPLQHSLLPLPRCHVSAAAVELAELVEAAWLEAEAAPPLLAARLHYAARHALELYLALLPTLHGPALQSLPEAAAVAHNNLQYLAHCVVAAATRHRPRMAPLLDLVPELRAAAADTLRRALQRTRHHLLQILDDAGLDQLAAGADATAVDRALRQCLHQLRHVCRLWRRVLPAGVQVRAAGSLLGVVCSEMTSRLLAQQDVSASAASQLGRAGRLLCDGAPALFMDEGEEAAGEEAEARALLARHTLGWERFCELLLLLEESMRGILDRWSDGKGPLAQHFTAAEVRHLVRALFQNNERRAATLAIIQ